MKSYKQHLVWHRSIFTGIWFIYLRSLWVYQPQSPLPKGGIKAFWFIFLYPCQRWYLCQCTSHFEVSKSAVVIAFWYYWTFFATNISQHTAYFNPNASTILVEELLLGCVPADLFLSSERSYALNSAPTSKFHHIPIPQSIPLWQDNLLCYLHIPDIDNSISAFISPNPLTAVSDWGQKYEGNLFCLINTDHYTVLAANMGKLYSIDFYEPSHFSEMYGVLALVVSIRHLISILSLRSNLICFVIIGQ
jgi:hypothetical protein